MAGGPDIEGLAAFAERRDRRSAMFFAGRTREIGRVGTECANALVAMTEGTGRFEGATLLIHGAPGAGKTALLSRMEALWTAGDAGQDTPLPVRIPRPVLSSEEEVVRELLRAIAPGLEERSRAAASADTETGFGIAGWFGMKGRTGTVTAPARLSLRELARVLPGKDWPRPVCLMVDEIQNVRRDAADVLEQLHLGEHGLPVVPVLAGLGSSSEALVSIGVSRLSDKSTFGLGALSAEHVSDAVTAMFDSFRVAGTKGQRRAWVRRLDECSEGWAQHLHNGMCALAEGLAAAGGRLGDVDAGAVAGLEAERRERSYMLRISPEMDDSRFLVAGLMAQLPEGPVHATEVSEVLVALSVENGERSRGWRLPEGMTPESFLRHLVHRGVFHQDHESRSYSCPIPSLRARLVEYGASGTGPGMSM